jgi:hypothetical protein
MTQDRLHGWHRCILNIQISILAGTERQLTTHLKLIWRNTVTLSDAHESVGTWSATISDISVAGSFHADPRPPIIEIPSEAEELHIHPGPIPPINATGSGIAQTKALCARHGWCETVLLRGAAIHICRDDLPP